MINAIRVLLFLPFFFLVISCSEEYIGEVPYYKPVPVINGVLYADSIIKINLSWSAPPNSTSFAPIDTAEVIIMENNMELMPPTSIRNGKYKFDAIAKPGNHYSLKVLINGIKEITANTIIPICPLTITKHENITQNDRKYSRYLIESEISDKLIHAVYVYGFRWQQEYNHELGINDFIKQPVNLFCNSPFADNFNAAINNFHLNGYVIEYDSFVRFPLENLPRKELNTELVFYQQNERSEMKLLFASKEFDLYYKGSFIQRTQIAYAEDIPTTYQPLYLPSNITNGTGIFAGISLKSISYD